MLIDQKNKLSFGIILLSLLGSLGGCQSSEMATSQPPCPSTPENHPPLSLGYEGDLYAHLQSVNIINQPHTITFQSEKLDFIYCRTLKSWIIQKGTYQKDDEYKKYEDLADPSYKTLAFQDEIYKYRVILDPTPFPDFRVEPKQVIFELLKPNQSESQRYTLYTLEQVKQKTGIQLGVPQITATQIHNDHLYWTVAAEQGEGFSGIATIIHYQPNNNQLQIIQPEGLERQQIQDIRVTGNSPNLTLWLATQTAGEGNPFLPGLGLVAYLPKSNQYKAYHVRNSPLVGMIPHRLEIDNQRLWVATGNGICTLPWQTPDRYKDWQCWQFSLKAKTPPQGLSLYPSSLSWKVQDVLSAKTQEIEVLWWSMTDFYKKQGRYEVVYPVGITVTLAEQGGMSWSDYYADAHIIQPWQAPLYWPGKDWQWNGQQFVRPLDGVSLNLAGGGASGIESWNEDHHRSERYAIRGNLALLNLTVNTTKVTYDSAWVEDRFIDPYVTLIPAVYPIEKTENPLKQLSLFRRN